MDDAVLVLGDYQQSLVVVRSLARAGHRVIAGQSTRRAAMTLSRYVAEAWTHPDTADRLAFTAALQRLLDRRRDIQIVFPVGESDLIALLEIHDVLARRAQLAMPRPDVVETCLDKPQSYALAAGLGLPIAASTLAGDSSTLMTQIREGGVPLVVKCPDSTRLIGGRKAVLLQTDADLARWQPALASAEYPVVLQRWAPGVRHNCHFAAAHGTLTVYFQQRVLRTDEPDGTGFGVEGVSVEPSPGLREHVAALARGLCYHGVGCAQFLVDDDTGRQTFLEINPRLDATCELPYRCGIDLPRLALDPRAPTPSEYPVGRRFHWLLGDARGAMKRFKRRELRLRAIGGVLGALAVAHLRAHHRLTWDWRDPLPTLYLYGQALRAGGRQTARAAGLSSAR